MRMKTKQSRLQKANKLFLSSACLQKIVANILSNFNLITIDLYLLFNLGLKEILKSYK